MLEIEINTSIVHADSFILGKLVKEKGALCEVLNDVILPKPYVSTLDSDWISCQDCLEWLHA